MKPWKVVLGAGAACAVCCAAPVVGAVSALAAGLFTAGLGAYAGAWWLWAGASGVLAALGAWALARRRSRCQGGEAPACGLR